MSLWKVIFAALVVAVLGFAAWVRLAPTDPAAWHAAPPPKGVGDHPFSGGFEAVRAPERPVAEVLAEADREILSTPRTRRIAGGVDEGKITYETRSALWGFPDYTTVSIDREANTIAFHARLRFGREDFGVNEARVRGWLARLGLGS